jgi:Zn-finger nucleic acid-binding protein
VISERQGIEIDYCPACRGVWLDRGELDKFIERAERMFAESARSSKDQYVVHYGSEASKKKKKSVFGELFDILD